VTLNSPVNDIEITLNDLEMIIKSWKNACQKYTNGR